MTKQEQKKFVKELVGNVVGDILKAIAEGKIPADWDGIELRKLLADKFQHQTLRTTRSRTRKYNNAVVVNNL